MANDEKKGILLEAGTNELEIVEFCVGDAHYGINIAKVREIIKADIDIVSVPDSHQSIDGAINLRGNIIPIINLARHLSTDIILDKKQNRIIISEFNQIVVGFWVSSVSKIHRISWREVEQPSEMLQTNAGYAVGIVKIDGRVVFLLDFEKIAAHINPKASMSNIVDARQPAASPANVDRSSKTILIAEDSDFIRDMIVDYLTQAGYSTKIATNGEEALKCLMEVSEKPDFNDIGDYYNLVITDIEMPQMDGLHLVKKIKDNTKLRKLPCIAFSSMITKELSLKCKDVGTDGEISKPEIDRLVEFVDNKAI